MPKKASSLLIVLFLLLGLFIVEKLIPSQQRVKDLVGKQPSEIYVLVGDKWKVFRDKNIISEFHALIKDKKAKRVGTAKAIPEWEYGYKGNNLSISDDGSILVFVSKTEIRNKSKIHWLWWKINGLYDRHTTVHYLTEPDEKVGTLIIIIHSRLEDI